VSARSERPRAQLLLIAKAPVPGTVKTRLCPPCTPQQAAQLAEAALLDTVTALSGTGATVCTLVLEGNWPLPAGWRMVRQRGIGLGARLANAFADAAIPGVPSFLVGMDTPQLNPLLINDALRTLSSADAALGMCADGGWWGLGLHDAAAATVLRDVPMSTVDTGQQTRIALERLGLRVSALPPMVDVDTIAEATLVADEHPQTRFATALRSLRLEVMA
jgi:uncharacterized protein